MHDRRDLQRASRRLRNVRRAARPLRILLVSQVYPSGANPDFGTFVRQIELQLEERGHEIRRAVVDRRHGGDLRYVGLARRALGVGRRFRPDVVYAHSVVPGGVVGALAARAPLVVTAHGRDVRIIGFRAGVQAAARLVARRAAAIVAVSDHLRRELELRVPEARGKIEVVNSGVNLDRFQGGDAEEARRELGWEGEAPRFLCVGGLVPRKNVVRLARAFDRLAAGSLAFVGDGPLRPALEGRPRVRLAGRVPHAEVSRWLTACDVVCQPSTIEPFGQSVLEAMASERSVVATRVGGPPEFVVPEAGVLVDPLDEDGLVVALRRAAALPRPNLAARAAASRHDVRLQAGRIERILLAAARG